MTTSSEDTGPPLSPGRSVGIDLGTTNSAVAVIRDGQPFIIPNAEGLPTTPSVVAYRTDAEGKLVILVGREAEAQAEENPAGTFASVKRVIGRKRAEIPSNAVSPTLRAALEQADQGEIRIRCPAAGRPLRPEEVSAEARPPPCRCTPPNSPLPPPLPPPPPPLPPPPPSPPPDRPALGPHPHLLL